MIKRIFSLFLAALLSLQGAMAGDFTWHFPTTGGAVASLSLDFTTGVADSRLTISGGAGGTRVNSSGNIVSASAPRFDYDPVSLAARGLLVEEQRTNLLLQSAGFSTASWTKLNGTATADTTVSPDGTQNADTLTASTADAVVYQDVSGLSTSTSYTFTVYLKADTSTNVTLFLFTNAFATVASQAITVTTSWQRFTVSGSSGANTTLRFAIGGGSTFSSGEVLYAWGAQAEAGSFATSYIPTTTAQVTRTADSVMMTGAAFSSWFNASQGAILAEFDLKSLSATDQILFAVNDGTGNNLIQLRSTSSGAFMRSSVVAGGAAQWGANTANGFTAGAVAKGWIAFQSADFAAVLNGGTAISQSSGTLPTGLTRLDIGAGAGGASGFLNGHVRRLLGFPVRQPNATGQVLTQ
jgi:hypothetical protein